MKLKPRGLGADDMYPHPNPEAASEAREDLRKSPARTKNPSVWVMLCVRMMKLSTHKA